MTLTITQQQLDHILTGLDESDIKQIEQYVMFLGHAHSGHSIIGAIIDSHPDAAIANEINVPKLMVDFKLSSNDIKKVTLYNALSQFEKNWTNTGYRYNIPDSHQGRFKQLRVLGDKKGGGSTRIIRKHPWVFEELKKMFLDKFKIIHVKRNLYDNIAALAHYWKEPIGEQHVIRYFENLETIIACQKNTTAEQWLTIDHGMFINNLDDSLDQLFDFLKLELTNTHRRNIKSIVNKNPHSRRHTIEWPEPIHQLIHKYQREFKLI